ncbi:MAG: hypothetical protein ACI4JB_09315 [Porcipelethomonas sp.]
MSEYKLRTGKIGDAVVGAYKKIEDKFVETFLNEDGSMKTGGMADKVASVYQKIEDTVVGGYKKVENAFVETILEKTEDETTSQESETAAEGETASEEKKDAE